MQFEQFDADSWAPPPSKLHRHSPLWAMVFVVVADGSTFGAVFVIGGVGAIWEERYSIDASIVDCAVLACLRSVLAIVGCLRPRASIRRWLPTIADSLACLAVAKTFAFTHWAKPLVAVVLMSDLLGLVLSLALRRDIKVNAPAPVSPDVEQGVPSVDVGRVKGMSSSQLLKLLKPYFVPAGWLNRALVVLTWSALILQKVCTLWSPLFIGEAVQTLADGGGVPYLAIIVYSLLVLSNKFLKEVQNISYIKVKQTAYRQLAVQTFWHLHALSLEWHVAKKMGEVLRSMDRGVNAANNMVSYLFLYLMPAVVECVLTFMIFYSHFEVVGLASVAFLSFAVYIVLTVRLTLWRKKFRERTNKHDNEFHDRATDSLINYETVKYFTNEQYEVDYYSTAVGKFQKYSVVNQASLSLLNSLQSGTIQLAVAVSLLLAAAAVANREAGFAVGDMVSVQMYMVNLFSPLSFLGTIYSTVIQALIDMQNLSELLSEQPDVADVPGAVPLVVKGPVALEFDNVSFKYKQQAEGRALSNVSFTVPAGTTTAIVGTTGAGKTTLSRLIFRFYDVHSGAVRFNGADIARHTQRSVRGLVGIVPQDTVLFNDTILHNVRYGDTSATLEEVEAACRKAQILDFILGLPDGWETRVGERGLKLSGGEKQRVAIARCLLKDPPIVVLDEATSALDTETEQQVQRALQGLSDESRTFVVIAHRLSTVMAAEQIVVLQEGSVVEAGTHVDLLAKGGKYAAMWAAQQTAGNRPPAESELPAVDSVVVASKSVEK